VQHNEQPPKVCAEGSWAQALPSAHRVRVVGLQERQLVVVGAVHLHPLGRMRGEGPHGMHQARRQVPRVKPPRAPQDAGQPHRPGLWPGPPAGKLVIGQKLGWCLEHAPLVVHVGVVGNAALGVHHPVVLGEFGVQHAGSLGVGPHDVVALVVVNDQRAKGHPVRSAHGPEHVPPNCERVGVNTGGANTGGGNPSVSPEKCAHGPSHCSWTRNVQNVVPVLLGNNVLQQGFNHGQHDRVPRVGGHECLVQALLVPALPPLHGHVNDQHQLVLGKVYQVWVHGRCEQKPQVSVHAPKVVQHQQPPQV
jgi:hypothetical protein